MPVSFEATHAQAGVTSVAKGTDAPALLTEVTVANALGGPTPRYELRAQEAAHELGGW